MAHPPECTSGRRPAPARRLLSQSHPRLDSESEAANQRGLAYLMQGRTTFVVAPRRSTIRRADQILVVEAGRIVERGTHASLLETHGRCWDLYTRQHGLDSNLFLAPGEGDASREDESAPDAPPAVTDSLPRLLPEA